MLGRCLALLGLLFLAATASAAVEVRDVQVPERTVAGHPFEASVTLINDETPKDVTLFGALYSPDEGASPCGPATGPRFRTFTHVVQERIHLDAHETVRFPEPGERWLQRYAREHAGSGPQTQEFCVFVARVASEPTIQYEGFDATALATRPDNRAPEADFSWSPRVPEAAQPAAFEASATDADGDPLRFRWDFGHVNASGRAVAEGARVAHRFYPDGTFQVTLVVSDGFSETRVSHAVDVAPEGMGPVEVAPAGGDAPVPLPAWALVAGALGACIVRRRF